MATTMHKGAVQVSMAGRMAGRHEILPLVLEGLTREYRCLTCLRPIMPDDSYRNGYRHHRRAWRGTRRVG